MMTMAKQKRKDMKDNEGRGERGGKEDSNDAEHK